eukprot:6213329-Pleurochrysis_carterae.AAC.4
MRLVVLVPLVARMNAVEVLWLARLVLVVPPRHLLLERHLERELRLARAKPLLGLSGHHGVDGVGTACRTRVHGDGAHARAQRLQHTKVLRLFNRLVTIDLLRAEQHWAEAAAAAAGAAAVGVGASVETRQLALVVRCVVVHLRRLARAVRSARAYI